MVWRKIYFGTKLIGLGVIVGWPSEVNSFSIYIAR